MSIAFDLLLAAYVLREQRFAFLLVILAFLPGSFGVRYLRGLLLAWRTW